MKHARAVVLALALSCGVPATPAAALERLPLVIERADGVALRYSVEIARTDEERREGLMGRRSLAPGAGMLFDFGEARAIAMWMRNTYVALDMIFADADGRVVDVIEGAVPLSEALLMPRAATRYVVELCAGQASLRQIAPGAQLHLPARLRTSVSAP